MVRNYKRTIKKIICNETGVTLVEVIVSIALISMIVTTFLSFFMQAAKTNNQTDYVNQATFIAQEKMELLTHDSANLTYKEMTVKSEFVGDFEVITELKLDPRNESSLCVAKVTVLIGEKKYAEMETWLPFLEEVAKE